MTVVPFAAATPATPGGLLRLALAGLAAQAPHDELPPGLAPGALAAAAAAARAAPEPADAGLVWLADALGLDNATLLAVALAAAVETDAGLCRTIAALQAPVGGARPVLGLLATLAPDDPDAVLALAEGPAVRSGLLRLDPADLPLPERAVALHLPTLAALRGHAAGWPGVRLLPDRTAPPDPDDAADTWARALATGGTLVLRTPDEAEAEAAANSLAQRLGLRLVWIDAEPPAGIVPWLLASATLPTIPIVLKPGERRRMRRPEFYHGPLLLVAGCEGAVQADAELGEWVIRPPPAAARAKLWHAGGVVPDAAARAGATYRHTAARIATLATRAGRGGSGCGWDAVRAAVAAEPVPGLDALAVREAVADDVALVVPDDVAAALADLLQRCQLRERLEDGLGPAMAARRPAGVRMLLHGPSGTGKSLAAHWLASRLGMPLYRADLAALTSKWIGETEKNMGDLLAAAEHADVVLLFDEADSLFGARTDVGDAHDRFANAQTNYLLQRIETFAGIAVLTSNSRDRFDPAFTRRLDAILEFPLPDAPARRALWLAHLGNGHVLEPVALDHLALACDLTGGHIRNVVLAAAAPAAAERRRIGRADITRAAVREYAKLGRPPPAGLVP